MPGPVGADARGVTLLIAAGERAGRQDSGPLPAVLFYSLLIAIWVVFWRLRVRQRRAEERWAASRDWRLGGPDPDLARRWREVFGLMADCRVSHLIAGDMDGRRAASFELGDGHGWRGYRWHVVTMSLPARLPMLQLTPEVRRGRAVGALGGQDLTFESAQFNQTWHVQSERAKFAHDVLHPRLLERLLKPDTRALSLRIDGSDIICWRWGPAVLGQVDGRVVLLKDVVDAIPRFVWLEHGYDPGFGPAAVPRPSREPAPLRTRRERFAQWSAVLVSSGVVRRRRGRPLRRRRRAP